jgi:glucose/arabinose dehydrogenase
MIRCLAGLVALCAMAPGMICNGQAVKPIPDFKVEVVAEDLRVPWSIVFLPDGRMVFTERTGTVRMVERGELLEKPLLIIDSIENTKKMGLLGMTLHPDFRRNNRIYLAYNYRSGGDPRLRVARYRLRGKQLVDPETIIEDIPANQNHSGCRLLFGPDGKLYISTGDADVPMQSQELTALNGKILRVNDDGSIPGDNPFVHQPGVRGEIWSYGHRNPQGIYFQPDTGFLFDSEHGPNGGDEINHIQKEKTTVGRSFIIAMSARVWKARLWSSLHPSARAALFFTREKFFRSFRMICWWHAFAERLSTECN